MTDAPRPPGLQEWIARYGGYASIPWDKWDAAVAAYQARRREVLATEIAQSARGRAKQAIGGGK